MKKEAEVAIGGVRLPAAQSAALRLAVQNLLAQLRDSAVRAAIGPSLAHHHLTQLEAVERLIVRGREGA